MTKLYRQELIDMKDPVEGPVMVELYLTSLKPPILTREEIMEVVESHRQKCLRNQRMREKWSV